MSKRVLLACVLVLMAPINAAWADGRTVAYLQGVAFAIAANCKHYSLDSKAIALSKNNASALGIKQGNALDFASGAFQFHELLNGPPVIAVAMAARARPCATSVRALATF
jgi:hypothetical protein